jgi:hypothetical protein
MENSKTIPQEAQDLDAKQIQAELNEVKAEKVPTLEDMKPAVQIDFDEFEGCKAKIEDVEFREMPSKFVYLKDMNGNTQLDAEGKPIRDPEGKQWVMKVYTESVLDVPAKGDSDNDFDLRASELFNFNRDEEGNTSWGSKSNLGKFMKKLKIQHPKEMIGKLVTMRTYTKLISGEEKTFLGFIKE